MNRQILSDPNVNSYGLKIKTSGIDLTRFKSNPIMLFNHNADKILGTWKNIEVENDRLVAEPDFDQSAEEQKGLYERNVLKGASIGIMLKREDVKDGEILKSELYEVSLVSIPSNKHCLKFYKEPGVGYTETELKLMFDDIDINKQKTMLDYVKGKLGLSPGCTEDEVSEATLNLKEEVGGLKKLNAELESKVELLQAENVKLRMKEKETFLHDVVKKGEVSAKLAEELKKLSLEAIKETLSLTKPKATEFVEEDVQELDIFKMSDEQLNKIQKGNPELYKKLMK